MHILQVQIAVQADPAEVGRARRWARKRLAGSGLPPESSGAESAVLVVSELVTNAVVHTGRPAVLKLLFPAGRPPLRVRVEVADGSARPPVPGHPGDEATSGRGLELVDCLCDRWGWFPEGSGKRVWCEIDCREAAPAGAAARPAAAGPAPALAV